MQGNDRTGVERRGAGEERAARRHDRGLLAIGAFKLVEAVFFLLVGVGAIHFIHHDLGDAATRLAMRLRIDPDGTGIIANAGQLAPYLNGSEIEPSELTT